MNISILHGSLAKFCASPQNVNNQSIESLSSSYLQFTCVQICTSNDLIPSRIDVPTYLLQQGSRSVDWHETVRCEREFVLESQLGIIRCNQEGLLKTDTRDPSPLDLFGAASNQH